MSPQVNPNFKEPRRPKKPGLKVKRDTKHERWSKAVRERDGHCQFPGCGSTRNLEAQHVAARSQRPDLRYDLANGVALCQEHHRFVTDNPNEGRELGLVSSERYEKPRVTPVDE